MNSYVCPGLKKQASIDISNLDLPASAGAYYFFSIPFYLIQLLFYLVISCLRLTHEDLVSSSCDCGKKSCQQYQPHLSRNMTSSLRVGQVQSRCCIHSGLTFTLTCLPGTDDSTPDSVAHNSLQHLNTRNKITGTLSSLKNKTRA